MHVKQQERVAVAGHAWAACWSEQSVVLSTGQEAHQERLHEAELQEGAAGFIVPAADILAIWPHAVPARVAAPARRTKQQVRWCCTRYCGEYVLCMGP